MERGRYDLRRGGVAIDEAILRAVLASLLTVSEKQHRPERIVILRPEDYRGGEPCRN